MLDVRYRITDDQLDARRQLGISDPDVTRVQRGVGSVTVVGLAGAHAMDVVYHSGVGRGRVKVFGGCVIQVADASEQHAGDDAVVVLSVYTCDTHEGARRGLPGDGGGGRLLWGWGVRPGRGVYAVRVKFYTLLTAALVAIAILGGVAALTPRPAMATETPAYDVVRRWPEAELRRYGPTVVAETRVEGAREGAGSEGFRRLAGYIFGGNSASSSIAMTAPVAQSSERIAMTAPVAQAEADGAWVIQFTMPSRWTLDTLPVPDDRRVTLRAMSGGLVLARRYAGTWSEARYAAEAEALDAVRVREGMRAAGAPVWARYDPPWKPWFLRRNEILLPVAEG